MKKLLIVLVITAILCALGAIFVAIPLYDAYKIKSCQHDSIQRQIIQPTCTDEGKTINRCTECSYEFMSDITPRSAHDLKYTEIEPTCSYEGYKLYYCACGYSFRSEHIPPLSHSLAMQTFSATCTEQGYCHYSCENCDYGFDSDYTEPLGHSFKEEKSLPTATQAGYTLYTCDCSYSYKGNYIYYSDILESAYTENTAVLQKGVDISRWNHQIDSASGSYLPIDWEAVKAAGFEFVILKAGSTKSGIEPTFEMDYAGAKAAGLEVGAYFYTYSLTVEGITKDVEMLMLWLEGKQFEYPIYLDLEDSSLLSLGKNHLSAMCEAFLGKLQANGYYAGLYTNHNWLTNILDTARMVTLFDIWYARYPGTSVPTWNEEKYGRQLGMWQFTESGTIPGLDGYFDFNYSYKDYSELMKKWGLNGY